MVAFGREGKKEEVEENSMVRRAFSYLPKG